MRNHHCAIRQDHDARREYCLWLNARWRGHRSEIEHGCTHGKDYWQFASERFSAIYALDNVIYNQDRHAGNYLFVQAQASITVKAYDFSRAWTATGVWPIPKAPLPPTHTVTQYRDTRKHHPFDVKAAEVVLDRAKKIKGTAIQTILSEIPPSWMADDVRKKIVKWWTDGSLIAHVEAIRKGFGDGTYL
jgi:hypothetical protein